jgi:3-hydroxyisobutyrate dehydrogenase-like beta-hydroxyacid dehydrogenase
MTAVGFIGLGRMGSGMAARLLGQVGSLIVHDVAEAAVARLVEQGAEPAASAREVGARAEIVFASLPGPAIVERTIAEAAEGGAAKIIVDLSTSGPRTAIRLAETLGARGIASFDAPVSGGIKGAR